MRSGKLSRGHGDLLADEARLAQPRPERDDLRGAAVRGGRPPGTAGENRLRPPGHMPQTVTGAAPPADSGRRKIFSSHVLDGERSKTTRCPDSAPQRSM